MVIKLLLVLLHLLGQRSAAGRPHPPTSLKKLAEASRPPGAPPLAQRAAAGRRLLQEGAQLDGTITAGPAAAPAAEGAAQRCLDVHLTFGASCQVSIDRVASSAFPRGSTRLPTAAQQGTALAALKDGRLPANG